MHLKNCTYYYPSPTRREAQGKWNRYPSSANSKWGKIIVIHTKVLAPFFNSCQGFVYIWTFSVRHECYRTRRALEWVCQQVVTNFSRSCSSVWVIFGNSVKPRDFFWKQDYLRKFSKKTKSGICFERIQNAVKIVCTAIHTEVLNIFELRSFLPHALDGYELVNPKRKVMM